MKKVKDEKKSTVLAVLLILTLLIALIISLCFIVKDFEKELFYSNSVQVFQNMNGKDAEKWNSLTKL